MRRTNPLITLILSATAAIGLIVGLYAALHSPLFMVRVVEIADQPEDAPLDAKEVTALAAVPLGEVSLVDLNLSSIQRRLESHSWVRGVILTKRFPQTLAIQVIYRTPLALFQGPHGRIQYVDQDGVLFGNLNLRARSDLPILSGLLPEPRSQSFLGAVSLLKEWTLHSWKTANQISQISYDDEEGFQVWITFHPSHRVAVVMGQDFDAQELSDQLTRIDSVLEYIVQKSVPARQIHADASKKIVVRTVRGS
jgi:cell division septal protein FtsQ